MYFTKEMNETELFFFKLVQLVGGVGRYYRSGRGGSASDLSAQETSLLRSGASHSVSQRV